MSQPRDYVALATGYATDVINGTIPACKWVKLACERQLNDLQRTDFAYHFDKDKASRVCRFIELLPHIKGEWAGKPIQLEPWQMFILTCVFGWVDSAGRRRFRTAYTEIPRKNAKSTLSSGVGLYMLTADGEGGPEVYSAATTKDQAKIVWQDAHRMAQKAKGLGARFGVSTSAHSIFTTDGGAFKALARDQGGNLDGLNVHCGIIDELHAHKTREVWDVIETATGARTQPLLWGITTAGFNRAGICYEQRTYVTKILQGVAKDDSYFGVIWTLDEEDDWANPSVWAKANPNWNVSVKPDDIERKARKAQEMTAAQNNFLTKHLNVWVNADTAWMDMKAWESCANPELSLQQFHGEEVWVALDLASKLDVAAKVYIFKKEEKYYLIPRFYLPEEAAEQPEASHYAGWAKEGFLHLTDGNVTDQATIEEELRDDASRFTVVSMGYDPWQATYLATRLAGEGLPVKEYRNTVQNMSEPMKQLEMLVKSGQLEHDGNPMMTWMISNVVAHVDAKENIFPRKEQPQNKIDGPVAAIMALGEIITTEQESGSVYDDRGFLSF
jgi:phage terminase large subunit-like protein